MKNWTWMFYDDADFYIAYDPLIDSGLGMASLRWMDRAPDNGYGRDYILQY